MGPGFRRDDNQSGIRHAVGRKTQPRLAFHERLKWITAPLGLC